MENGSLADWVGSISTTLAVVVALAGYWIAERHRIQSVKDDRRKSAHTLGAKIAEMSNSAWGLALHFSKSLDRPKLPGPNLFPQIHPLIGEISPERFLLTENETAMLIESSNSEFMTKYTEAVNAQCSIYKSLEEYRSRYDALRAAMPSPELTRGIAQRFALTDAQMKAVVPIANMLTDFLSQISDGLRQQLQRCDWLSRNYHPTFKKSFKGEKFIKIEMPPAPIIPPIPRQENWDDLRAASS